MNKAFGKIRFFSVNLPALLSLIACSYLITRIALLPLPFATRSPTGFVALVASLIGALAFSRKFQNIIIRNYDSDLLAANVVLIVVAVQTHLNFGSWVRVNRDPGFFALGGQLFRDNWLLGLDLETVTSKSNSFLGQIGPGFY